MRLPSNPLVDLSEVEAKLSKFVADTLDMERSALDQDTDLLKTGRLDSLAMVALVTFLEEELGVTLSIEQLVPENFASIRRMSELVTQASAQRA